MKDMSPLLYELRHNISTHEAADLQVSKATVEWGSEHSLPAIDVRIEYLKVGPFHYKWKFRAANPLVFCNALDAGS